MNFLNDSRAFPDSNDSLASSNPSFMLGKFLAQQIDLVTMHKH